MSTIENFIKLHLTNYNTPSFVNKPSTLTQVFVNPDFICSIMNERYKDRDNDSYVEYTLISMYNGKSYEVIETLSEINNLIKINTYTKRFGPPE